MIGDFLKELEGRGSIPFEKFMEAALYHPEFGYYTKQVRTVGRRGDFSTWPGLRSPLAAAVASWLRAAPARHIIEAGAGTGQLAAGVLKQLGFFGRLRTTLHIVEISPVLRDAQQRLLKGQNVVWHRDMAEALSAVGGHADIYSNELPDAFPCRVFVRSDSRWKELALTIKDGSAREVLIDSPLPDSTSLQGDPPDGYRVEVHDSYRRWLGSWSPFWKLGRMLTIDYGAAVPGLYHRRPAGTLRAYAHHQRLTGPDVYASFGHRDITADVNFTDLENWARELGWNIIDRSSLTAFIRSQCPRSPLGSQLAEAGEAFQVLDTGR